MKVNKHDLFKKRKEQDDELKCRILTALTILISFLLLGYGFVNLITNKKNVGIIELIAGVTILSANTYLLYKKKQMKIPAYVLNSICILLGIYLYIDGGFHNTGIFWLLSFPVLYLPTMGTKTGTIWMIINIFSIFVLFIFSRFDIITVAYDGITTLSALIVYFLIAYILLTYEIFRKRSKKEIRKLEGLLPICSYCKKIKSVEGKWQSVDSYLTQQADMDFSHGICPDCMKEVYPEYYDRMQKK